MGVKVCMNNGLCLRCDTHDMDAATDAITSDGSYYCCPRRGGNGYSFCVRKDQIASWEDTNPRPKEDPGKPDDVDGSDNPNDNYRITINLPKGARLD